MKKLNFALIGAAGYIAPRHMKAIKEVGGELVAATDPSDCVGAIDSYFINALFFRNFEEFDRHLDKIRHKGEGVSYVTICSPDYMHDAHIRFALGAHAHAICEKPLVLNSKDIGRLQQMEDETGYKINTIMQLRFHKGILDFKKQVEADDSRKVHEMDLTYITSRGPWWHTSWKGDEEKSGGIIATIGIHFFDMLSYIFGPLQRKVVHTRNEMRAAGYMEYERAKVRWFLSIDHRDLPPGLGEKMTYRSIRYDDKEIEFSEGFTDLHTVSYQKILDGEGFGLETVRNSLEITEAIRRLEITPNEGPLHPFLKKHL